MNEGPPLRLLGEARFEDFKSRVDDGSAGHAGSAIFPIIRQEHSGRLAMVGTGFFIALNGVFATAKHVATDVFGRSGQPEKAIGALHLLPDQKTYLIRPFVRAHMHDTADIALGVLASAKHNVTGNDAPNRIVKLTSRAPALGSPVFTYAYPKTVIKGDRPQNVDIRPAIFDGQIVECLPQGRDRVLLPGPCFRTSMVIHSGASGAPVFDSRSHVVGICSTGFTADAVSYVSSIGPLLDLRVSNVVLPGEAPASYTVRDLARLGHVSLDEP